MNRYYDTVDLTDFAEMKLVWENLTVTVLTEDDNRWAKPWRKFLQRRRTKALNILRAGNRASKFSTPNMDRWLYLIKYRLLTI